MGKILEALSSIFVNTSNVACGWFFMDEPEMPKTLIEK